jgi:hypothetical protein
MNYSTNWMAVGGLCALVSLGCGPADLADSAVDEVSQEAEFTYDMPAVGVTQVFMAPGGVKDLWVFACLSGRLKRNTAPDATVPVWRGWQDFGECTGKPAAYSEASTNGPKAVVVYTRRLDNHLYEIRWPTATGRWQTVDVSLSSGIGSVVGNPTIVYAADNAAEVSVAMRQSGNYLYTLDLYDDVWHRNAVLNGVNQIRTANTTGALVQPTRGWGFFNDSFDAALITGRGLTSSDDTSGWLACRKMSARGSFKTGCGITSFQPRGTPTVARHWPQWEDVSILANINGSLKWHTISSVSYHAPTGWVNAGCSLNGSPVAEIGGYGYGQSSNAKLLEFSLTGPCSEKTFAMTSGPAGTTAGHVFYTGLWAELYHYYAGSQQSLGVTF